MGSRRERTSIGRLHLNGFNSGGDPFDSGDALLVGAGTNSYPATSGRTNKSAADLRVKFTGATGTNRLLYGKLFLSGGAGGEAIRAYTVNSAAAPADTCNGAHLSLGFGASAGNITGLGTAARCTLHIPNRSLTGTTAAVQAELYSDGASSAIGGVTSLIRGVNDGNASGKASVDTNAYFAELSGFTAGSGKFLETAGTVEQALKIRVGSNARYVPVLPATTTGIVLGVGSSSAYYNFGATADKNAMEFRFTTAATTGTSRGIYNRLKVTAGAGGESLRSFTDCENNTPADTVNGAHISLKFGSSAGNVTGLGTAGRFTLQVPNRSLGGTTAGVMSELWSDGTASANGGTMSFLRAVLGGNATGLAAVEDTVNLVEIAGGTNDTGNVVGAVGNEPTWAGATYLIRSNVNGVSVGIVAVAL